MDSRYPVILYKLSFAWPLSFCAVEPDQEFGRLAPPGAKLVGVSYSPAALVAHFSDGSAAYRGGGGYSWSAPAPLSEYLDPTRHPLQRIVAGSLHFVGLTRGGEVVSSKAHYGEKVVRRLDTGGAAPIAGIAAGAFHALAITEAGGLLAWPIGDTQEAAAAVAPFTPLPSQSSPASTPACTPASTASAAPAAAGTAPSPAPLSWLHPGLQSGRLRVTHASAGSVHSLVALSDGSVHVAGAKASQRFSRTSGTSTTYVREAMQVQLPVPSRRVLLAEACGAGDTCCVATDAGVVCWADDRTRYEWSERGWCAEYAPAPRHLPQLDGVELTQIALSEAYDMAAALAADGRIFTWCVRLSERGWPAAWLEPALAATASGALSIGWSNKDLYVAMPEGSCAGDIQLAPQRPEA